MVAIACFDGHSNLPMSTKISDQCRRTTGQNASSDILFELDMLVTIPQRVFLANRQNKHTAEVACFQSKTVADFHICNSAIQATCGSDRPVILARNCRPACHAIR